MVNYYTEAAITALEDLIGKTMVIAEKAQSQEYVSVK